MANLHRGEIDAILDGQLLHLCLTLGALAELEATFGDEDMLALAERFSRGRLSARDAVRIIGAGLRGAGHQFTDDAVARMRAEGGAAGFVDIVSRLLTATFGTADDAPMAKADAGPATPLPDTSGATGPFPGTT
ncbi:MAG: gene transfer agent family protein [Hyphomicrobiaceae bacterium]